MQPTLTLLTLVSIHPFHLLLLRTCMRKRMRKRVVASMLTIGLLLMLLFTLILLPLHIMLLLLPLALHCLAQLLVVWPHR
jgi:hypothetical protein